MTAHQCQPIEYLVPFWRTCRTCLKEIEVAQYCKTCNGDGRVLQFLNHGKPCPKCKGTGVGKWEPVEVRP